MDATELEGLCGAWTGATRALKFEDELVFSVAGKAFAVLCLRGPDRGRLSFRVDAERFVELTAQPGVVAAHYAARPFWITLTEPERFARAQIESFLRRSYDLVRAGLSKRQQAALVAIESGAAKKPMTRRRKG